MTVNLSIKGVPDALAQRLRERAEVNHRSLQGELMSILESALVSPAALASGPSASSSPSSHGRSIQDIHAALKRHRPEAWQDTPRSVDLVRELRDNR